MIELPTRAERNYLRAIGVAAIYALDLGDGWTRVGITRDLESSQLVLGAPIGGAWWVASQNVAQEIVREVYAGSDARVMRNRLLAIRATSAEIGALVVAAAGRADVGVAQHATAAVAAAKAARRVSDALEAARRRGEMGWFSEAYKVYRAAGRPMSFRAAWTRLCLVVTKRAATVERLEYGSELLFEVFGGDINILLHAERYKNRVLLLDP